MNDLTFYAQHDKGAKYVRNSWQTDAWAWLPPLEAYLADPSSYNLLVGAGWEKAGIYKEVEWALLALCSQLADVRLLTSPGADTPDMEVWTNPTDTQRVEQLPVILSFSLSPSQKRQAEGPYLVTRQAVPPASLGEIGMIAASENDGTWHWVRCKITRLPAESQKLQQHMGAALSRLAAAHLERTAWLEQWKEIQAMAQQLAADYWRAYQDSLVERPAPINIWKLRQGEAALAAMTMVQDGAHASISNKGKWEREHMIEQGTHQGLVVGRYVHTTESTVNEYWMQHPEGIDAPINLDLVSQEVSSQQAKLGDLEADLVTLAPVYLLVKGEEEVYISPEQLLKDLDFTPNRNQSGYGNTYHPDETRRIIEAFERLAWLQVKTRQRISKSRGRKPAIVTFEEPYIDITGREWQEPLDGFGPRHFIGWRYRITWLKEFTGNTEAGKQLGILLKKSFQFSEKQYWEKRLARYLTIHLNVAAHKGQYGIDRKIRHVLEQNGLMPSERDVAHPGAYAARFENAMDNLKAAHIIGDWKARRDRHAPDFPARDWLNLWLDGSFHVTQAPAALEAGYQKMIGARQAHKKEQK